MFQHLFIAAIIGSCCTAAYADPTTRPTTAPTYAEISTTPEAASANDAMLHHLENVLIDIHLDDAKLADAFDVLRADSKAEVFVDWKSLKRAGIERDTPITLHLKNKRVPTVLSLILEIAAADREPLAFGIDDGIMIVTAASEIGKSTITRVIDIRQLLDSAHPPIDAQIGRIEKLLMDDIEPATWKQRGGDIGSMRVIQGQLIITHTRVTLERIAGLVRNLIAMNEAQEPAK